MSLTQFIIAIVIIIGSYYLTLSGKSNCTSCNNIVAKNAIKCPSCGKISFKSIIIYFVYILIIISIAFPYYNQYKAYNYCSSANNFGSPVFELCVREYKKGRR